MTLTPQQIGKRFEHDLENAFRSMQKVYGFTWHRFVDTHEAGNAVREQPSDFLVTTSHGLALVEAKASATVTRFRPSMLRPSQRGAIRHYAQMLGMPYYILFRSDEDGIVEVHQGKHSLKLDGRKPLAPLLSTPKNRLEPALGDLWGLRPIRAVLRDFKNRYGDTE